jgi:outer membrane protein OmpA-like peptidoglycan-associated protein
MLTTKAVLNLLCVWAFQTAYSQQVQWASKVLDFSSEYGERDYAALNIIGLPTSMPSGGGTILAWCPKNPGTREFVKVGFKDPKPASRLVIAENVGAGSIRRISLLDEQLREYTVYTATPRLLTPNNRLFQFTFPLTAYPVHGVYVELDASLGKFLPQLDGIGISDAGTPVILTINVVPDIKFSSKPENLGPNVNSASNDVYPVISPDGTTLYFARFNHAGNTGGETGGMDIWLSVSQGNSWSPARNAGYPLNGKDGTENNYVISVLPDGNTLYLGGKRLANGSLDRGVSVSTRNGNSWTVPKGLEIDNFYNSNVQNSFCVANDGSTMILGVERDDTFGRQDLYVSFRKANGTWSEPQNLGNQVNTLGNEYTPFLAADGVTLYFSSNGYPGFGDHDIYITRRLDDTWEKWSKPQNLGNIINTPEWDAYYTVPASGEYAYFVSYNNSLGGSDLYRVVLPNSLRPQPVVLVSGRVLNAKTRQPVSADVMYETQPEGRQIGLAHSGNGGEYKITLPAGSVYGLLASAKGFLSVNESLDATQITAYQEINRDLLLSPIETGQSIRLNSISFAQGEFALLSSSYPELNRIVTLMKDNPTMEILLEGHTDYLGKAEDNLVLSQNRVKAVKNYIVKKGIADRRIQTKAYGGTQPLVKTDNEQERKSNRRVEFKILRK